MLLGDATTTWVTRRTGMPASPRFRRAAIVLGIVAAEFPDSDLVYAGARLGMGNLGYLLHHRGHTHTVVWATVSAVLLWLVTRWWWRRGEPVTTAGDDAVSAQRAKLPYERALLGLALVGTWSHLLLDWTNSYGVHPFWPLDNRWMYGDAVFIVEPWLWVAAIPPLLFGARSRVGRVVLALLLVVILVFGGVSGAVARGPLTVLCAAAVVWCAVQWWLRKRGSVGEPSVTRTRGHVRSGLAAWAAATLVFTGASRAAKADVRAQVAEKDLMTDDIVLAPAPGDPMCWSALVVTHGDGRYRVSSALAAPVAGQSVAICEARYVRAASPVGGDALELQPGATMPVPFPSTTAVQWRRTWSAADGELAALAGARCEVAEALRFMRIPVWDARPDGGLLLVDARFGVRGGFTAVALGPANGQCTLDGGWIPPWRPPRVDALRR